MSEQSAKPIDWVNTAFLTLTPTIFFISLYYWLSIDGFSFGVFFFAFATYMASGIGITAGYHRLLSHKTYEAHPVVKFFLLIIGASAFQNSALKWSSDHRIHHSKVDEQEDPYNINKGFWYAHIGWILRKSEEAYSERYVRDLLRDKLVMWQYKYYLPIAIICGGVLPILFAYLIFNSWWAAIFTCFFRIVMVHHCTFFINSLCHCVGTRPYTDTNSARDSWFMAFFSFGEGYHNYHHYFQTDYRNGIRWFHFDPTKWLVKSLSFLGLTKKLKITPKQSIVNAQLSMKLKKLKLPESAVEQELELEEIKKMIVEKVKLIENFAKQIKNKAEIDPEVKAEIKQKLDDLKAELSESYENWKLKIRQFEALQMA